MQNKANSLYFYNKMRALCIIFSAYTIYSFEYPHIHYRHIHSHTMRTPIHTREIIGALNEQP